MVVVEVVVVVVVDEVVVLGEEGPPFLSPKVLTLDLGLGLHLGEAEAEDGVVVTVAVAQWVQWVSQVQLQGAVATRMCTVRIVTWTRTT